MYQRLLTRRYLTSKVMPLLAVGAVALSGAMVLIVWSVMGGFLNMLLASGKAMIGDASIAWPISSGGLTHYEEVIDALEARDEVAAATPMIESFALARVPGSGAMPVMVVGVEPEGYDAVTGYDSRLYWRPLEGDELEQARRDKAREEARLNAGPGGDTGERISYDVRINLSDDLHRTYAQALREPDIRTGEPVSAVVPGIAVTGANRRTRGGFVEPRGLFLPNTSIELTVVPQDEQGNLINLDKAETRRFPVANEFSSGLFEADSKWVIMPLADLQDMLRVDEASLAGEVEVDANGFPQRPDVVGSAPAKVSHILIRAAEGFTPKQAQAAAEEVYAEVASRHDDMRSPDLVFIYTWEERPGLAQYIAAVKRETVMVVSIFSVVWIVASFLIFAIFWSMISEKTKDIGILRALGASRGGVAWLFLRYGLAIGVVGSLIGLALAWVFIVNINAVHAFLAYVLGVEVWSAETYMFTEIPSDFDLTKAALVAVSAIVFSLIGALVPALRAARMDPVRALRFE